MDYLDNITGAGQDPNLQGDSSAQDERLTRYKQQMQGWQTEAQRKQEEAAAASERAERYRQSLINTNYKRVYVNWEINVDALSELVNEDPELADDVAKKFEIHWRWVNSADEILQYFWANTTRATGTLEKEKLVDEITSKLKWEFERENAIKSVRSHFDTLPEWKREQAQKYFDELIDWRKVTQEKASEYARMAITYVYSLDNSTSKKDKKIAAMASLSLWGWAVPIQTSNDDWMYSDDELKEFVQRHAFTPEWKQLNRILYGNN